MAGSKAVTLEAIQGAQSHAFGVGIFAEPLESAYRDSQNNRYRMPRLIMYGITATVFLASPLYMDLVFRPSESVRALFLAIVYLWAVPAMLLALLSTARDWADSLQRPIHTWAALTFWGVTMSCQYLGLLGHMDYPSAVVPIAVLAVAVFGGYHVRRFLIGATITLLLHAGLFQHFGGGDLATIHLHFESLFIWIIAVAAAITGDQLSRNVWLRRQELYLLSRLDRMTNLLNSTTFHEQLERLASAAYREGKTLFVAIIDLDHFKSINDRFGHAEGDRVIREAARVIRESAARRSLDLQGRIGGEEFAIAMYDIKPLAMQAICDDLLAAIRKIHYGTTEARDRMLTTSIGGYCGIPASADAAKAFLREADRHLYEAKEGGRDRAVIGQRPTVGDGAARPGSQDLDHLELALNQE
jgi:diguanylate cyclase (GGDEF)-like protein